LGLDAGINLFVYVDDKPVNAADPFGLAILPELPDIPFFPFVPPCSGPEGGKADWQERKCSSIAKPLNVYCHARNCCKKHDECYEKHICNMWSWIPICGSIACKMCNLKVVICLIVKVQIKALAEPCCNK